MKFSYALPLLCIQLLSPSTTKGGSVVLATGFSSSLPFLTRGGGLTNSNSQLASAVEADIGPSLGVVSAENWSLLSERGKAALSRLILYDVSNGHAQKHVYGDWPERGVDDEEKKGIAEQVSDLMFVVVLLC